MINKQARPNGCTTSTIIIITTTTMITTATTWTDQTKNNKRDCEQKNENRHLKYRITN